MNLKAFLKPIQSSLNPKISLSLTLLMWILSIFYPRTYTQIHTPTVVKERVSCNPPPEFSICCSILKRFCLQWSLPCSQRNEIYFMDGGTAGGLWRHHQWSPPWPPSWILPRIRNQVKTARNGKFLCWTCTIRRISIFASFYPQSLLLLLKEV